MNKNILNIVSWSLFGIGVLFLMSFVSNKRAGINLSDGSLEINIQHSDGNEFLTPDIIKKQVAVKLNYHLDSAKLSNVNIAQLERTIKDIDEVKSVEVYKSVDGKLMCEVKERVPVIRVIHQNGMSNYIDEDGIYMHLSAQHAARVPIVTGYINESEFRTSVSDMPRDTNLLFDDIYQIGNYIHSNELWNAQIQEIYVNKNKEFELVPLVGDHRIIFGTVSNMIRKFKKLEIFYKEGLNNTGWNEYKTINVKYKNQIVCS
jgi:cell division protein FtsQ